MFDGTVPNYFFLPGWLLVGGRVAPPLPIQNTMTPWMIYMGKGRVTGMTATATNPTVRRQAHIVKQLPPQSHHLWIYGILRKIVFRPRPALRNERPLELSIQPTARKSKNGPLRIALKNHTTGD